MKLDLTPLRCAGKEYSPIYFGGNGETMSLMYRGQVVKTFRTMQKVGDNEEFLAQGRHQENAQTKRKLNSLPYKEWSAENRARIRQEFIDENS